MNEQAKYLPADERRSATVEAVVDLAAQQNPSDITTTAIAQHMGLTQGALFRHFPSKDAILQAVMTWVAERLLLRLDKAAGRRRRPRRPCRRCSWRISVSSASARACRA